MKLVNTQITAQFNKYPFRSQSGKGGEAQILCAFRLPSNTWRFYVLEAEPLELDAYSAGAMEVKTGKTWALRGIVFDDLHPKGRYSLLILADLEQRKIYTPVYNSDRSDIVEYIEERAERMTEFVPCRVAEVVEDLDALTADEQSADLLPASSPGSELEKKLREVMQGE